MTKHWERQLDGLRRVILTMGSMVESQVEAALLAASEMDRETAQKVLDSDDQIDALDIEVEEESLHAIALFQPVASDLRSVVATMSVAHELERIGDLAGNIAACVMRILEQDRPAQMPDLLQSARKHASEMLREGLDAFIERDAQRSRQLIETDAIVDELHHSIFDWLKQGVAQRPEDFGWMIEMTSISRHVERIADHVTNIAEIVIYLVEGDIVRHRSHTMPRDDR